jgi:hypothetical protein
MPVKRHTNDHRLGSAIAAVIASYLVTGCADAPRSASSSEPAEDALPSAKPDAIVPDASAPEADGSDFPRDARSLDADAPTCTELRAGCACANAGDVAACCMPGVNCLGFPFGSDMFLECYDGTWHVGVDGPCFRKPPMFDSGSDANDARE